VDTLFLVTISANFGRRNLKADLLKHQCEKYLVDKKLTLNSGLAKDSLKYFVEIPA